MKIRKSFVFEIDVEKLKKHMGKMFNANVADISDNDILDYIEDCTKEDIIYNWIYNEKSWVIDLDDSVADEIIENNT